MKATIHPAKALNGKILAQPSKNFSTRHVLAAALAEGRSHIAGVATSEDAAALRACLSAWGVRSDDDGTGGLIVHGLGGRLKTGATLRPHNAGAVARFCLALTALSSSATMVAGVPHSLGRRPMDEMIAALQTLGLQVSSDGGRLPISVSGPVPHGGELKVSAARSSQFVSGLLFLAPLLRGGLDLQLTGEIKSAAAIRQTLHTLRLFGIECTASADLRRLQVPGGQAYQAGEYRVPGDYPGSLTLLVAGAILPGEVTVCGLDPLDPQGEKAALDVLEKMGAQLVRTADRVTVRGGATLGPTDADGDIFTDAVQVMCAAAAFASGESRWSNVATLRLKECDRITETRLALQEMGVVAAEGPDWLAVTGSGGRLAGGVTVHGRGDHRMIMLQTLLALRGKSPVTIEGAEHIAKSYPRFFDDLRALGARIDEH